MCRVKLAYGPKTPDGRTSILHMLVKCRQHRLFQFSHYELTAFICKNIPALPACSVYISVDIMRLWFPS